MLDHAIEGEAESIDSKIEYMVNGLCAILCAINTHGKEYIDSQCKRDNIPRDLEKNKTDLLCACANGSTVRVEKMRELKAYQTMSEASRRLRDCYDTAAELGNVKLCDVLHLMDGAGQAGFIDPDQHDKDFNKKHVKDETCWCKVSSPFFDWGDWSQ